MMFRCLRNGDMRDIIADTQTKDVKIPIERFFETRMMLTDVVIKEGAMEAYMEKTSPYIDENGEAVITNDVEALVKGIIQRCIQHNISPLSVFYHAFTSIGDPKHVEGLHYLNTEVDPASLRKPKMLEFEQAVRYLGLPLSIEGVGNNDFVSCDNTPHIAVPTGVRYAIWCKPGSLNNGRFRLSDKYARMEFLVPWTDELKTYLPDMENRYYAYKDGEDSGWRL